MRRFMLLFAASLVMSAASFAEEKEMKMANSNLELHVNTYKLSECLDLRGDQFDKVSAVCEYFADKLDDAARAKEASKRAELVRTAVLGNLKLMKDTLNPEQYRKYVALLNLTLQNRGLDVYMK